MNYEQRNESTSIRNCTTVTKNCTPIKHKCRHKGEKQKCINLIEVIDKGKTKFKDDVRIFRRGGTPSGIQTDQQERQQNILQRGNRENKTEKEEYIKEERKGEIIKEEQIRDSYQFTLYRLLLDHQEG